MEIKDYVLIAKEALEDKKGTDIKILDITGLSPISDYFVLATGSNINQVKAMSDEVLDKLSKNGVHAKHIEGYDKANWILMDYGDFMVHIFSTEGREFYNLERIWRDAKVL